MIQDKLYFNKWKKLCILGVLIGIVLGVGIGGSIYDVVGFDKGSLLANDTLIAIKNYNVPIKDAYIKKMLYRTIEIVMVCILMKFKCCTASILALCLIIGTKIGFISSILFFDMGYIGIINYMIISLPQDVFYYAGIYGIICISIYSLEKKKNGMKKTQLCDVGRVVKIVVAWSMGIISEILINVMLVQKFFVIP